MKYALSLLMFYCAGVTPAGIDRKPFNIEDWACPVSVKAEGTCDIEVLSKPRIHKRGKRERSNTSN